MSTQTKLMLSLLCSYPIMYFEPYFLLVKALGFLVIIDIVSGLIASRKEGVHFSSRRFFSKFFQIGLFLMALAAAKESGPLLAEFSIELHQAGKWLCGFYGVYELFSILENLGRCGLPVARQFLELMKSKLPVEVTKTEPTKQEIQNDHS